MWALELSVLFLLCLDNRLFLCLLWVAFDRLNSVLLHDSLLKRVERLLLCAHLLMTKEALLLERALAPLTLSQRLLVTLEGLVVQILNLRLVNRPSFQSPIPVPRRLRQRLPVLLLQQQLLLLVPRLASLQMDCNALGSEALPADVAHDRLRHFSHVKRTSHY